MIPFAGRIVDSYDSRTVLVWSSLAAGGRRGRAGLLPRPGRDAGPGLRAAAGPGRRRTGVGRADPADRRRGPRRPDHRHQPGADRCGDAGRLGGRRRTGRVVRRPRSPAGRRHDLRRFSPWSPGWSRPGGAPSPAPYGSGRHDGRPAQHLRRYAAPDPGAGLWVFVLVGEAVNVVEVFLVTDEIGLGRGRLRLGAGAPRERGAIVGAWITGRLVTTGIPVPGRAGRDGGDRRLRVLMGLAGGVVTLGARRHCVRIRQRHAERRDQHAGGHQVRGGRPRAG